LVYIRTLLSGGTCVSGVVVQRIGHPGHLITADPWAHDPTFTDDGQHVLFVSACDPDLCGLYGVWETTPSGADRHEIFGDTDRRWFCLEGGICLQAIAATAGGWMDMGVFADEENGVESTCFQSAAETADGTEAETAPGFCLDGLLTIGFDA
jgi:hypothetical protein